SRTAGSDKSGVTLDTPSLSNNVSRKSANFSTSNVSFDSTITVVVARSPGAKLSSNKSNPPRVSISSGYNLIKLNEYSFVSTLSDTTSITTKIIEPKTPGRFVTLEASLCQNPRFSFAFEPTLGIYGQNDFLPNKTNSAGSNVNPPTKIK